MLRRKSMMLAVGLCCGLVFAAGTGLAAYANRGNLENNSEFSVKVVMENEYGDYEFETLPQDGIMHLHERIVSVMIYRNHSDPPEEEEVLEVVLRFPDGDKTEITDFRKSVRVGEPSD